MPRHVAARHPWLSRRRALVSGSAKRRMIPASSNVAPACAFAAAQFVRSGATTFHCRLMGPPESCTLVDLLVQAHTTVENMGSSASVDGADSFALIRGGHVDVAIMGGLQVDARANLANWAVPGKPLLGVGGAMDLASAAKRLVITMTDTESNGRSKIVPDCTLPLTAVGAVNVVITELAVFEFAGGKLRLIELMPGTSLDEVRAKTTAAFVESIGARALPSTPEPGALR